MARFRRTFTRGRRMSNRRWLWIRSQANSVTAIPAPSFQTVDLLANYRTLAGIDLNLPEFTIWRIRIKISVRLTPQATAATHIESNSGVTVAIFCDNMAGTYTNPVVAGFDERYLLWDTLYTSKVVSQAIAFSNIASVEDVLLYQEYDLKGRRRLGNIGESLLLQVAPLAEGTIQNYSYQQSTLVLTK